VLSAEYWVLGLPAIDLTYSPAAARRHPKPIAAHPPLPVLNTANLITLVSEGGFGFMVAEACPHSTASKFRLLYLGTDLKLLATLRQTLTEPVYRVVASSDHGGALLFLKSQIPYDALLIDLEWRGKDGLEVARLARSLKHRKRMPIVLLADTNLNRQAFIHNKAAAAEAGVHECILKTQDVGEVIRRLIPET